jgi:long-chain acyl-CoA synthetase
MMTTPIEALYDYAIIRPGGTAFIHEDEVCTYYDLVTASEELARALLSHGVQHGDRIVLHLSNRREMVFALYACFRIGAIACPMDLRYKTSELRETLHRLRPSLYLGEESLYVDIETIEPDILAPEKRFVIGSRREYKGARPWSTLLAGVVFRRLPPLPDEDTPAIVLTTSGTTGQPKFVTHTPASLMASTEAFAHSHFGEARIVLNSGAMAHGSGLFTFVACVNSGVAVVLVERFDPDIVLDQIEAHGCTSIVGLPFMFQAVLKQQLLRPRKVNSLRHCICIGDVCPISLQADFKQSLGAPLRSVWGSTEASGSLTYALRPGPVYRIVPGVQVRLVDDDGRTVQRGDVGEFLVRGREVATGYWIRPGLIGNLAPDGWFHSGDLMRQDENDELWFVGRKKDLIIRDGSAVSPIEIERVLLSHPLVRDAAVFGLADPVLGQRIAAVVQLQGTASDATDDMILSSAKLQLADYKVPEWLAIVDAVPRDPLGRIDRQTLARGAPLGAAILGPLDCSHRRGSDANAAWWTGDSRA